MNSLGCVRWSESCNFFFKIGPIHDICENYQTMKIASHTIEYWVVFSKTFEQLLYELQWLSSSSRNERWSIIGDLRYVCSQTSHYNNIIPGPVDHQSALQMPRMACPLACQWATSCFVASHTGTMKTQSSLVQGACGQLMTHCPCGWW